MELRLWSAIIINKYGHQKWGVKKWKSRLLNQTQPEVYGKVKLMATSERVKLFYFEYGYNDFDETNSIDKFWGWESYMDRSRPHQNSS